MDAACPLSTRGGGGGGGGALQAAETRGGAGTPALALAVKRTSALAAKLTARAAKLTRARRSCRGAAGQLREKRARERTRVAIKAIAEGRTPPGVRAQPRPTPPPPYCCPYPSPYRTLRSPPPRRPAPPPRTRTPLHSESAPARNAARRVAISRRSRPAQERYLARRAGSGREGSAGGVPGRAAEGEDEVARMLRAAVDLGDSSD